MKQLYLFLFISLYFVFSNAQTGQTGLASTPAKNPALFQTFLDSATQVWAARYNGPGNDWDEALAIAVDGAGNVYVTGGSPPGLSQAFDYATIKYNSSGTQEWVARYNGPANNVDEAFAIVVDNSGNVYVTGYSDGGGSSNDYATIKYNSSGIQQWIARYDGPGNDDDAATALAVDNSGNVYVTGYSRSTPTNYDYASVKYDPSGNQVWAARYNGTGNSFDQGTDIEVDDSGNVFVAGWSAGTNGFYNYAVIKYNSLGTQQWVSRYNGPVSGDNICTRMAIDDLDNIYVTGGSTGSDGVFDYATIKYNSSGAEQWTARYDGTGNSFDEALDIKVDASGNVYVTGKSVGLNTGLDYAVVKYSPSGNQEWAARYDGPLNADDEGTAIAIDNSGSIYVTGVCVGVTSDYDYTTIKYNSSGEQQWITFYNGPGNLGDRPFGIALDASGNVYVTGYSFDSGTSFDYATIKYEQTTVPVELISFSAVSNGSDVSLSWVTSTETNNKGFDVERSAKGAEKFDESLIGKWEKIGFVEGNGTTTLSHSYNYIDKKVAPGKYSYRLKQIDFEGSYEYSKEVEVSVTAPMEFSLEQNYPNPFNPGTKISWQTPTGSWQTLKVYDILGNEIATLINEYKPAGRYDIEFNASNIPSGVYFYQLKAKPQGRQAGDPSTSSGQVFIQTKKMILLK